MSTQKARQLTTKAKLVKFLETGVWHGRKEKATPSKRDCPRQTNVSVHLLLWLSSGCL